ncbi:unnamed protein product [Sphagnum compactum]
MAASSLQTYSAHCTGRPHGGLLHFHLSSQVGSGSGNLMSTLLCRRHRGMLGWVLLMPQCPPPPHLNYSQTSQKLGQILLPGKKKKKKNIMAMVPNKESGKHTVGKQSQELKFDTEDLLELKFGRLLGESRETTLAKVMGRKINPDASYVEIEKPSWKKNLETKVHEAGLPQETDFSRLLGKEERSGTSQQSSTAIMPITAPPTPVLAQKPFVRRPTATIAVPGDVVSKFTPPSEADSSSSPSLGQPEIIVSQEETRRRETTFDQSLEEEEEEEEEEVGSQVLKQPMPTTTLAQKPISRRPSFVAMDAKPELQTSSGSLKRPILQLRTKKDKPIAPPAMPAAAPPPPPPPPSTGVFESELSGEEERLPDQTMISDEVDEKLNLSTSVTVVPKNAIGDKAVVADKDRLAGWSDEVKAAVRRSEVALECDNKEIEINLMVNQWQEEEDRDWLRAEALLESSAVEEMLFFGANAGGMLVSFRSLVGFLPAWELSAQRRPPSFRTWAMDKGFTLKEPKFTETFIPDSSLSGVELPMGSRAVVGSDTSKRTQETSIRVEDDNQRNLLKQYREERRNALSKLIGETARVVVIGLDRGRRRLRLSEKAAEGEGQELTQKKANVMEGLNVGDVVCCTVKKVTSYGAFVEVQGVPALIHISELSWNRIVDPTTVVAVGQELEAKVCRLDRFMQRINLSLKQMQVDPLRETLESLLASTDMELETVQEIPEVNGVIKRLEQIKGIDSVVKGRCLQGMAMAPSFQVYLSGQLSNGYKLIARSGNQVQEVLVLTSLDRESAKQAILQCTMRDD